MKKKIISALLCASMVASMAAGCGNTDEQTDAPAAEASGTTADAAAESGAADTDGEEVTIKLFSNLPDRKNGQGLVEQTIIDQYMSENPTSTSRWKRSTRNLTRRSSKRMRWTACRMLSASGDSLRSSMRCWMQAFWQS